MSTLTSKTGLSAATLALAAQALALPARLLPAPTRPRVCAMPGPFPARTGWAKWLAWIRWSLWYPIDWLLYEDYYRHLTRGVVCAPSITMTPGYPPPSFRFLCDLIGAPIVIDDREL